MIEPQKELDGREIYWSRGKMLGGSSSMNAMAWVRGFAADDDEWGSLAGDEWDYAHFAKHFTRIENGPLVISRQRAVHAARPRPGYGRCGSADIGLSRPMRLRRKAFAKPLSLGGAHGGAPPTLTCPH